MFRQDFHGIAPKLLKEAKLQALDIMVKLALKVAQGKRLIFAGLQTFFSRVVLW